MLNIKKNKLIPAIILVLLGIFSRTYFHLGPNVEFVTVATLLAASYLGIYWSVFVPLGIMLVSDVVIGNTNIFIFTWSAYIIIGLVSIAFFKNSSINGLLKHFIKKKSFYKIIQSTFLGLGASVWFYLWTNFGVWILDSWGMYDRSFSGLLDAYILGIPFLKYNLIGNMVIIPLTFTIVELSKSYKFIPVLLRFAAKRNKADLH